MHALQNATFIWFYDILMLRVKLIFDSTDHILCFFSPDKPETDENLPKNLQQQCLDACYCVSHHFMRGYDHLRQNECSKIENKTKTHKLSA